MREDLERILDQLSQLHAISTFDTAPGNEFSQSLEDACASVRSAISILDIPDSQEDNNEHA